jgi:hypothetical protein
MSYGEIVANCAEPQIANRLDYLLMILDLEDHLNDDSRALLDMFVHGSKNG